MGGSLRDAYVAGLIVAILLVASSAEQAQAEKLIDFSFTSLTDGKQYSTADYQDYHKVLIFGSIYCRPCVGLLPVINKYYEDNRDMKILVVGVDIDSTTEESKIRDFVSQQKIKYPFFVDDKTISRAHKVFMLPSALFVAPDGTIEHKIIGPKPVRDYEKELERIKARSVPRCTPPPEL